jgi:AbrB family looped-hinge helix DNA binding protein
MTTTIRLDSAGRVVIPKMVRDELQLEPGDSLELESEGTSVILRPTRTTTPLHKERGVWVFRSGGRLSAAAAGKALFESRGQRDRHNRGERH